ncbi:MAG: YggS family pyridoxal phosphate-dependent enzyme [Halobacteriovoraceae bacterium]|nr:YggS family pyridoxal phosphate-dependent enzyme [Halobacteriovoraceae bacterium]
MINPLKKHICNQINELKSEINGRAILIAVSKYSQIEDIKIANENGQKHFGENHLQDLEIKSEYFFNSGLECLWHFLGPLQSKKIKNLLKVKNLWAIHSVCRIKELETLKKFESELSSPLKIFIQVNTSGEIQKNGLTSHKEIAELINCYKKLEFNHIELHGLMTIGKIRSDNILEDARSCFQELINIKNTLDPNLKLSMGMTSDYKLALEMSTNYVRIGSKIFKE